MRDRNGKISLDRKEADNIWDSLEDFLDVYTLMKKGKWQWVYNSECKYVDLRVDMRDGGCIIKNREGKRIPPHKLKHQIKVKKAE